MKKLEMYQMESFTGSGSCEAGFEICSVAEQQSELDYVASHQNPAPTFDLCAILGSMTFLGVSFLWFDEFKNIC